MQPYESIDHRVEFYFLYPDAGNVLYGYQSP